MRQKSLFVGFIVDNFWFFRTRTVFMLKILFFLRTFCPKGCIPARPLPRFAAQLPCSVGVLFQYMLCRRAKRRARAVLIPPATSLHRAKRKPPALFFTLAALAEMVGSPAP